MRLQHLSLRNRGVLQKVDLTFDTVLPDLPYGLDFLVGVNGAGKSTLIKTIAALVDMLGRGQEPDFPFELAFRLEGEKETRTVKLGNQGKKKPGTWFEGAASVLQALPPVIVFTAGNIDDWTRLTAFKALLKEEVPEGGTLIEELLTEQSGHLPLQSPESAGDEPEQEAPLGGSNPLVIQPPHLPLVLLSGWLTDQTNGGKGLKEVFDEVGVAGICGFSLRLNGLDDELARDEFIQLLAPHAARSIRHGTERRLFFDCLGSTLPPLLISQKKGAGLFFLRRLMDRLAPRDGRAPLLLGVDLILQRRVDKERLGPVHLFEAMSDGEQSFMGRMALLPLLGQTEALVLLDEPEVHFNDYWKRSIVYFLNKSLGQTKSHILIATHASITLTDVPKGAIHVLQREGIVTVGASEPAGKTFGVDASEIMTQIFNTPNATGRFSSSFIRESLEGLPRDKEARKKRLKALSEQVGPGYWSFLIRRELLEDEPS